MFHSSPPVGALRARASKPAYLPQGFRQAFLATGRACSLALAQALPLFAGARSAPPAFLSPSQRSSPPVGALRARASKPAHLPQGFRQAFLATGRGCSLALAAPLPLFSLHRGSPPAFLSPSRLPSRFSYALHSFS